MSFYEYLWAIFAQVKDPGNTSFTWGYGGMAPSPIRIFEDKLNALCEKYKEINNFISRVREYNPENGEDGSYAGLNGLYISAFSAGIEEVLNDFYDDVVKIERDLLNDSEVTLLSLLVSFEPLAVILEAFLEAIQQIDRDKIKGCNLFDLCHKYTLCGESSIENAFKRIEGNCLKPFFMQVQFWILKSELYDPYGEFFIKGVDDEEERVVSKTVSVHSCSKTSSSLEGSMKEMPRYIIDYQLLPDCIPKTLASKLLFIGECLTISQVKDIYGTVDNSRITQCYDDDYILGALQNICNQESFSFSTMDIKLNEIWSSVNKEVRKLVNDVGNVRGQLLQMRDIYLLARGELFQEFLMNVMSELKAKVSKGTRRILNKALATAMYSVYLTDNTELIGNIEFVLPAGSMHSGDVIENIQIASKIKWPLHYLFSPHVMDNYNKIFRFLLQLKKAQMDILSVWMDVNHYNSIRLKMLAVEIRNQLLALIGNLQNYCFTDVIATEMNIFTLTIESTDTYTELQKGLLIFQNNIINQLFLTTDEVMACFKKIFDSCEVFAKLIRKSPKFLYDNLLIFKSDMTESIKSMFIAFGSMEAVMDSSAIRNLLLNLDRNRYFRNK